MKEFSVGFYRKLIIFVLAVVLIAAIAFMGLAVKSFFLNKSEGQKPRTGTTQSETDGETKRSSGEKISSGDDLNKLAEKAEKQKKEREENQKKNEIEPEKVVYLTFDDGASKNTTEILSILKENGIKATFFFNASEKVSSDEIIRQAYEDGNAIGISTSLRAPLSQVYASPEDYGRDIDQSSVRFTQIIGEKPTIMRFPGGSKNAYTSDQIDEYLQQVNARGLAYFDWNLSAEAEGYEKNLTAMVNNSTRIRPDVNRYILLMHDSGNINTCEALRQTIKFYKENGFLFMPLSNGVEPIVF